MKVRISYPVSSVALSGGQVSSPLPVPDMVPVEVRAGDPRRRDFLRVAGAGVAALFIGDGCKCNKSKRCSRVSDDAIDIGSDGLPHVQFRPARRYSMPEMPSDLSGYMTVDEVSQQLTDMLHDHFVKGKQRGVTQAALARYILDDCASMLVRIHPAFHAYVRERMPVFDKNQHLFVEYVNKFLLPQGRYLFVELGSRDRVGSTNFYTVSKSLDVSIDGYHESTMHFVGKGVFDDSLIAGNLGLVNSANIRNIVMRFGAIDDVVEGVEMFRRWTSLYSLRRSIILGVMYHEAIHVHVEKKFSSISDMAPVDLSRYHIDIGGLWVYVDGRYTYDQIHELCAVGGELATARDASQAIIYLRNFDKKFSLVRTMLKYLVLKHMDSAVPVKRDHLRRMKPPATYMDSDAIRRYFDVHNDVGLIHKVGREMLLRGMNIFEWIRDRHVRVRTRQIKPRQ